MKKNISLFASILISMVILSSCLSDWNLNSLNGDGNVVSEIREIQGFTSLEVSGGLNVFITFGREPGAEVVADENLQSSIITAMDGNILKIKTDRVIRNAASKDIYLSVPSLNRINVSSAAVIQGQNTLDADNLSAVISSAGKLKLDIITVELQLNISSAGSADINGTTGYLDVNVSSAGELNAKELEADQADVKASSAGNARLYVKQELKANASSAGSINYYGNPASIKITTSSAGSINKKGD